MKKPFSRAKKQGRDPGKKKAPALPVSDKHRMGDLVHVGIAFTISPNPYEVLDISPLATPAEIKTRYHQLALLHHPDKCLAENRAIQTPRFVCINWAYGVLRNGEARICVHCAGVKKQTCKCRNFEDQNYASADGKKKNKKTKAKAKAPTGRRTKEHKKDLRDWYEYDDSSEYNRYYE